MTSSNNGFISPITAFESLSFPTRRISATKQAFGPTQSSISPPTLEASTVTRRALVDDSENYGSKKDLGR